MTTAGFVRVPALLARTGLACALALLLLVIAAAQPVQADAGETEAPAPWVIECIDCPHAYSDLSPQGAQIDSQGVIHIVYGGKQLYHAWQGPAGWLVEVADPTANVGRYASLAIDATDRLHAVYMDDNAHTLRYAVREAGAWRTESVDATAIPEGNPYISIAVASGGRPHVAYYLPGAGNLYYLVRSDEGWQKEVVDSEGDVGRYAAVAVDSGGSPHIVYYDATNSMLRYAVKQGGTWALTSVEAKAQHVNGAALALDSADNPHIAATHFADVTYYAPNGAGWRAEPVPGTCTSLESSQLGACGLYLVLRLDGAANPRVAYYDHYDWVGSPYSSASNFLRYAQSVNGQWTLDQTRVEVAETQFVVDAAGVPHILGMNGLDNSMELADHVGASGSWQMVIIDQGGGPGAQSSLAVDSHNRVHVCSYDNVRGQYLYGVRDSGAWAFSGIGASTQDGRCVLGVDSTGQAHVLALRLGGSHTLTNLGYWLVDRNGWSESSGLNPVFVSGYSFDLAVENTGNGHAVSTYDAIEYRNSNNAQAVALIDSSEGVGEALSIALDSQLVPHVAYVNRKTHTLRYGTIRSERWITQTVTANVAPSVINSWSAAIAVGPDGAPQIAYANGNSVALARLSSGKWKSTTVDTNLGPPGPQVDLAVDSRGRAHIAYYDSKAGDLKYALVEPGKAPKLTVLDSNGDVGWSPSIALDLYGQPHISYRDVTHLGLKQAYWLTPTSFVYLPAVRKNK